MSVNVNKTKKNLRKGRKINHKPKSMVKPTTAEVRTIVKAEIARDIENKVTQTGSVSNSVLTIQTNGEGNEPDYSFFNWAPATAAGGVLNISQGVDSQTRVGNKIKLKRWVIKGTCYYDPAGTISATNGWQQSQGYINIYFGRTNNINNIVTDTLDYFYQNGSNTITPLGEIIERTYGVNHDYYKIYWHKQFKIGANTNNGDNINYGNNDYSLNHEFGFDVCKLCTKNLIVKYNDMSDIPQDGLFNSLFLFATYTSPNTNPVVNASTTTTLYAPARIIASSYVEYEDA